MKKRVIVLGFFDGVHLGHRELMQEARKVSLEKNLKSAVFTFETHPRILSQNINQKLILSNVCKAKLIKEKCSIQEVIEYPFTDDIMNMPGDVFIKEILIKKYNAGHIIIGFNNRFGYKGLGNSDNLIKLCTELEIGCTIVKPVSIDNITVSSTYIRNLILAGDIINANKFLGYNYFLSGRVILGKQIGRTIGCKTANISVADNIILPPFGVYQTRVNIDGVIYNSVTNIGIKPTLNDNKISIETHIIDFDADIYDKVISIEIVKFIRDERKFSSLDELKGQIAKDIDLVRAEGIIDD